MKVPEENVWYYKFGWLKIMIASLACLRSGVDMDMCFMKLKRNPHMQKIIDEYKELLKKEADDRIGEELGVRE